MASLVFLHTCHSYSNCTAVLVLSCGVFAQKPVSRQSSTLATVFLHALICLPGMFAIRARRKVANEKDFLAAVEKVIKGNLKFSSTAQYMQYN